MPTDDAITPIPGITDAPVDLTATQLLSIAQYLVGQHSLDTLGQKLGLNRVDTRQAVSEFLNLALSHSNVPVQAIVALSHRLAVAETQLNRLITECDELHQLHQELDAERRHLADLARQTGQMLKRIHSLSDTVQLARDYLALLPQADPDLLARLNTALEAESHFADY